MLKIILLVLAFFLASLISSYLTWGPLTSREMVDYFGPRIKTRRKLSKDDLYERRRRAGVSAEILRAFLITFFCLLVIPFYSRSIDVALVLYSPLFRWFFLVALILCSLWCLYFGPRFFAIRYGGEYNFFSKVHFKKFTRPYVAWLPYPLFIFGGIGLLTFMMIIGSIAADASSLQLLNTEISGIPLVDVEHIQYATIRLVELGDFISGISQKYILTTLLIFLYVIIEQRSSMRVTILDTSVERLKYFVWAALIFAVGFSLAVLPNQYNASRVRILDQVETMSFDSMFPDHLNDVLSIQKSLEDHDLRWIFLKIVTGYGNLLTAAIVSIVVLLWRLFFDDVPLKYIFRLIVPKYIWKRISRFGEGFNVDLDVKED